MQSSQNKTKTTSRVFPKRKQKGNPLSGLKELRSVQGPGSRSAKHNNKVYMYYNGLSCK